MYFSWCNDKPEAEIHTAKDGFDAGANFQMKEDQKIIDALKTEIAALKKMVYPIFKSDLNI